VCKISGEYILQKIFLSLLLFLFVSSSFSQQKIFVANIDAEIDLGMAPYIKRVIKAAEDADAKAIIFKINTFGGRVDAATQIKDAIIGTNILTIAYINNRAVSAGALISLSCNKICMVKGGVIGAATVVDQSGQKQSEKYQAYMRSEMRSTAEKNGRRTDIAEGMVDERVVIPGLVDSTKLVSLTSEEALKYGINDFIVKDIDDLLAKFNLRDTKIIEEKSNWAEGVVRFLNNGIVSSLLIMIGFFGLLAEIKSPGWGIPGTAGLIALALFFGSSYILELASIVEILLFIVGVVLLLLEIFVIPGFGIAGISGIILIIVSLFLSLVGKDPFLDWHAVSIALIQLSSALVMAIVLLLVLAKFLPQTTAFKKFILSEEEKANQGWVSVNQDKALVGMEGVAATPLRPSGTAEINNKKVDVVTESEFIERGKKIVVIAVDGMRVVVKEKKET
jgi:membrane-bound serine protease (ClpP class)